MSSGHRTATAFLTVLAGLLVLILGLLGSWPLWAWSAALVGVVCAGIVLAKVATPRPHPLAQQYDTEPDLPVPPPERRAQKIREVSLRSALPDYEFLFSATVRWCPLPEPPNAPAINPAGVAVSALLERAEELTRQFPPHRHSLAQHQLNGALGTMLPDPTGRLDVMAEDVSLVLAEADAERLSRLSTVRKEQAVWEHERKAECDKRAYLGDDVLKDTGSAVVWWLAKNDDQIKRAVDDIGVLAQLSSAANNEDVPELFRHMVPYPVPTPEQEHVKDPFPAPGTDGSPFSHAYANDAPGVFGHSVNGSSAATTASATDLLGLLLERLGFEPGDDRASMVARSVAHVVRASGGSATAQDILDTFAPPAWEDKEARQDKESRWDDEPRRDDEPREHADPRKHGEARQDGDNSEGGQNGKRGEEPGEDPPAAVRSPV
ncbi:hypothetical protein ACH4LN_12050 [Streptomyces albus]|uniref:hypothetical protein n=1 Tax=Streptomyces albus TaxID=1888 RepID=UPI0037AE5E0A